MNSVNGNNEGFPHQIDSLHAPQYEIMRTTRYVILMGSTV